MLHIINKSPGATSTLASLLAIAREGSGNVVLLIEDAVYAATSGNHAAAALRDAMATVEVYALAPDLDARGVADRLIEGVGTVDYGGFVDLVVAQPNCQSWL
ncbi:MAG: sulfurtransferase complex subunit TusB [Lautropia sp.]